MVWPGVPEVTLPERVAVPSEQMVWSKPASTVNFPCKVAVVDPLAVPAQVPFVTELMVYVVFAVGYTTLLIFPAVPLKVEPSLNVPVIVPGPVKAKVSVTGSP